MLFFYTKCSATWRCSSATNNFKWVKFTHMCFISDQTFSTCLTSSCKYIEIWKILNFTEPKTHLNLCIFYNLETDVLLEVSGKGASSAASQEM